MRKLRGLLLLVTATFLLLSLSGCGVNVSTKSPENVTKSIIQAVIRALSSFRDRSSVLREEIRKDTIEKISEK